MQIFYISPSASIYGPQATVRVFMPDEKFSQLLSDAKKKCPTSGFSSVAQAELLSDDIQNFVENGVVKYLTMNAARRIKKCFIDKGMNVFSYAIF